MPFDYPEAGASAPASGITKGSAVLKPYKVKVDGFETTLLLSEEDAHAQGLLRTAEAKKAAQPPNKARRARNKKG